jgi:hypothetical protein
MTIRADVLSVLESFVTGWANGDRQSLTDAFHASGSIASALTVKVHRF